MVCSMHRQIGHTLTRLSACTSIVMRMANEFGPFGVADRDDHRCTMIDVAHRAEARDFLRRQPELVVQSACADGFEVEEAANGQRVFDRRMITMHGRKMTARRMAAEYECRVALVDEEVE